MAPVSLEIEEGIRAAALEHAHYLERWTELNAVRQDNENTLRHLLHLKTILDSNTQALATLACAVQSARQVANTLQQSIDIIPISLRPSAASASLAARVFMIPELLECILMKVDPRGVLMASQTCRVMRETVYQSQPLQRKLHLLADPAASFSALDEFIRPLLSRGSWPLVLSRHIRTELSIDHHSLQVHLMKRPIRSDCPDALYWSMQVCQPPVTTLAVQTSCGCGSGQGSHGIPQTIVCESGFTFGLLDHHTRAIEKAHQYCPTAPAHQHNNFGLVRTSVYYNTPLDLRPDDPIVIQLKEGRARRKPGQDEYRATQARIAPYVAAKLAGK